LLLLLSLLLEHFLALLFGEELVAFGLHQRLHGVAGRRNGFARQMALPHHFVHERHELQLLHNLVNGRGRGFARHGALQFLLDRHVLQLLGGAVGAHDRDNALDGLKELRAHLDFLLLLDAGDFGCPAVFDFLQFRQHVAHHPRLLAGHVDQALLVLGGFFGFLAVAPPLHGRGKGGWG